MRDSTCVGVGSNLLHHMPGTIAWHIPLLPPQLWAGRPWRGSIAVAQLQTVHNRRGVSSIDDCLAKANEHHLRHRFRSLVLLTSLNDGDDTSKQGASSSDSDDEPRDEDVADASAVRSDGLPEDSDVSAANSALEGNVQTSSTSSPKSPPQPDQLDVSDSNNSKVESGSEEQQQQVDWDAAWANTRQKMERKKKDAAPFSGRKQVIASKNEDGSYDYVELAADGTRRRNGASEGFGFADNGGAQSGDSNSIDARGQIRDQEQQTVDMATTNKAFAGIAGLLAATLCFYVYVYVTGGITNGSTRFLDMGQPTVYDGLPLPASPPADDDLSV